jgi:predicted N-acetyltransferase YhbS
MKMAVKWCGCDGALYEQALALEEVVMNATRERFACSHRNNPASRAEFSRVCVVNGKVVSHIRIYERDYRIGTTPVPGAGIGDVCTHPKHRMKGYGAGCLRDAIGYFKERGQHMSMILSGVFGFYLSEKWEKFPQHTYAVPLSVRVPRVKKGTYAVRWFERDTDDLEQCMDVYSAYSRDKSLSVVRTPLYWRRRLRWQTGETPESFLVAERAGRIVGYVRGNGAEMCMFPEERDSALALYDALVRWNRKRQQERVRLRVPGDNPLFAVLEGNPKVEKQTSMGCLLRFIDLQGVLGTILDELQLRWLRSGLRWEGAFLFKAKGVRQSAALTVAGREVAVSASAQGRPAVLSWTQADLFKLLTGYGKLEDLPLEGVDKGARRALAALFPRGDVVFWSTDTV